MKYTMASKISSQILFDLFKVNEGVKGDISPLVSVLSIIDIWGLSDVLEYLEKKIVLSIL